MLDLCTVQGQCPNEKFKVAARTTRVMTCSTTPQQGAGRLQHVHTGKASVPPQTVGFSEKESLGRTRPLFRMTCWSRRIFFSCSSSNCLRASSIRRRSSIIASRSSAKLRCASSNCLLFSARVCSSSWSRFLSSSYRNHKKIRLTTVLKPTNMLTRTAATQNLT